MSVTAERKGDCWEFAVADNGIGMDPQHAEEIFEPFQRLHGDGKYPGTGIGLAVCQRIVEQPRRPHLGGDASPATAAPSGSRCRSHPTAGEQPIEPRDEPVLA